MRALTLKQQLSNIKKPYREILKQRRTTITSILDDVANFILALHKRFPEYENTTPTLQSDGFSMYFSIMSLDSFKDKRLTDMLEFLDDFSPIDSRTRDYPEYFNRDYSFEFKGLSITIAAYIKTDSPMCRRILIDVKEVVSKNKIYALVCD